jgi:hypothetical protein
MAIKRIVKWYFGAEDKAEVKKYSKKISTIFKIEGYYPEDGDDFVDYFTLEDFFFIPCIKEVKFAFDCNSISYEDIEKYIDDIIEWLDNMPSNTREEYEFDLSFDYDDIYKNFDGDEDKIRDHLVEYDKYNDFLDFILSDARLEKYGTDLRNDFCKWLTSR